MYKIITGKEANERFQISNYIHGTDEDEKYLLLERDFEVDEDLDLQKFCSPVNTIGLIIDGDLTLNGGVLYQPDMDYGESLFITGDLRARSIHKGGAEFYIKGNLIVEQTIYGYYNHGSLIVEGNTEATTIFAEDHYFKFGGDVLGLVIDTGRIEGVEADFRTTEPLIDELIDNEHYSQKKKLKQYIDEGRHIIKEQYIKGEKPSVSFAPVTTTSTIPKLISEEEAQQQFNVDNYEPFDSINIHKVMLLDGDTHINGHLTPDWIKKTLRTLGEEAGNKYILIVVNGNLTVTGHISPGFGLLVLGNVTCEVLQSYDECIYITGDADIKYVFDGNYNDGSIEIEGTTRVPYVINSDHCSYIKPEGAILINYFSDRGDYFDYDYTVKDFERVMVPEVLDEDLSLKPNAFIHVVCAGTSPLKKGARSARQIRQDELDQLLTGNDTIVELDLTSRKLKEFPRSIVKRPLKKLILNYNYIANIPAEIKELISLEELHVEGCGLSTLPPEIGMLPNLRVLNVANNSGLVLPESINQLSCLRMLNISQNIGFGLPASMNGLKDLEELNCYQCTTSTPIEFPEVLTQLTGLKRLLMENNSIKSIPDSFSKLKKLEELKLDASLCYLNGFPDLSKLKKLKTLHANGQASYTTRPTPEQSLLRSFFRITSLETLHIDRHGEREEEIKKEHFEEIERNLSYDPERLAAFASKLTLLEGGSREGVVREALKAEQLEGISNLKNLKVLDLSFNGLTSLPEEIFTLKGLQFLDLQYNRLPISERLKISKHLPGCTIDFRDNRVGNEPVDNEEVKQWQAMNTLITEANALMSAQNKRDKLLQSLKLYDEVLTYFSSGKVVDEYNLLYANYGKVWAYNYLTANHETSFSPAELLEVQQAAIKQGLHTLDLVPALIWQFTSLGKFHKEVTRITANSVAWDLHAISDKKEDLEKALAIILKGVAFIEDKNHYFIYDTQVRILLKLGRREDAYRIVKRVLTGSPEFHQFQDIKQDGDYVDWMKKQ